MHIGEIGLRKAESGARFKFQVALEAAKGLKTLNELSSQYGVHSNQISSWKRELLEGGATVFCSNSARQLREQEALQTDLYEQIGRLKMELEWLKKSCPVRLRPSGYDRTRPSRTQCASPV